ncbi:MAG: BtpA/SgcQ family protein, partial [Methylacidiphilaceae bacterium]|nr:BtpA/SgcQ family protein [Candidatus Methylacidiphilaceae bacterium]
GRVRSVLPHTPILVGSGITEDNLTRYLARSDGALVGSSVKTQGIESAVDPQKAQRLARILHAGSHPH